MAKCIIIKKRDSLWKKYQGLQEKADRLDAKSQEKDRPKPLEKQVKKAYRVAEKVINKVNKIDESKQYRKCVNTS